MGHRPMLLATLLTLALLAAGGAAASAASAAGDANTPACPNEALSGFAAFLPDCRAFERVSPAFTAGHETQMAPLIAADGSRILEASQGVFGGGESDSGGLNGAVYQDTRSGSGWQVSSETPPSSLLPTEVFKAASSTLARTLWFARAPGESQAAENAYVREPDGTVVEVGPLVPPADTTGPTAGEYQQFGEERLKYADASSDLSRVLFTMNVGENQFWPGDTTFRGSELTPRSLYEYAGVGNTHPMLVGVSDGSTVVAGKTLPAGHLISECATYPGSLFNEDVDGAISGDGERVFFTAVGGEQPFCGLDAAEDKAGLVAPVVSELYGRIGGLRTVAISEPAAADCAMCLTPATEGEGRRPGEFAGASADGSRVLFSTEQELFAGDSTRNLYMYDFANPAGEKIVRVSTGSVEPRVLGVMRVSKDGSHAYFVAEGALTGSQENANHEVAEAGADNVYVYERDAAHPAGQVTFVGRLLSSDAGDWRRDERQVQVTPDGRFVVFASSAHLVSGDTSAVPQIFEYDSLTGEMVRVSAGERGEPEAEASANSNEASIKEPQLNASAVGPRVASEGLAVSDDGSAVVFSTEGLLTRQAAALREPGVQSFYLYRSSGRIRDGGVFLLSGARGAGLPEVYGMDPSGADVFFESAAQLAGSSGVSAEKVFDARVNGGFATPAAPAGCVADACQGPLPGTPVSGAPGSASAPGGGNLPAPVASAPPPRPAAPTAAQVRAGKLAKALSACRRKMKSRRRACEKQARKLYGRSR